jgi:hypothetical protein
MFIIMNIETQKITIENHYYYLFLSLIKKHTFKGDHSTWNVAYNIHEIKINILRKKIIYNFDNNNAYTTNWENI